MFSYKSNICQVGLTTLFESKKKKCFKEHWFIGLADRKNYSLVAKQNATC